ncbi:MAG: hypothetical protein D3X82_08390 [Candidatus Leucobacter sulfamidivorax]|nr:hypothetical protein [Candidatus Leucobacter sulfamidivorax]
MNRIAPKRVGIGAASLLTVTLLLSGCASGGSGDTGGSDVPGATAGEVSPDAVAAVERGFAAEHRALPADGPTAVEGVDMWLISCGQAFLGCSSTTNATQEALETLGWNVTLVDGKGDPSLFNDGIRQALAARPDGIMLVGMDCPVVKTSLEQAKEQGVPVVAPYSFDCDDPLAGGSESLFSAQVNYGTESTAEFFEQWGALQADYVAVQTGGDAQVVELNDPGFLFAQYRNQGFDKRLAEVCASCEVVGQTDFTASDMSDGRAAQKASTLFAQHADANVFVPAYDPLIAAIAPTLAPAAEAGMLVIGSEGYPENIALIEQGIQTVAVAMPAHWIGWAAADTMNRVLSGETSMPDAGIGFEIVDKDHNMPADGVWVPNADYVANYKRIWGVG